MPRFQVLATAAAILATLPGQAWAQQSLILVPDSGKRRVSAFSALNGSIVNLDFLPSSGNLHAPWKVVQTPWNTLLVSDFGSVSRSSTTGEIVYVDDRIQEFTLGGQFIRTLVSGLQVTGGVVKGVGEGFQGVCAVGSTVYFVYSDSPGGVDPPPMPGNQNAVWRVEADGSGLQRVCDAATNPSLGVLRDIAPFQGDFLLSDSSGDDIERLSGNGTVAATPWHDSNGVSNINFPQHVLPLSGGIGPLTDGACLVAGFSSPRGLYLYDAAGVEVFVANLTAAPLRVELPGQAPLELAAYGVSNQAAQAAGSSRRVR